MAYRDFTIAEEGFAGYMVFPDEPAKIAVINLSGSEQSRVSIRDVAHQFARYGYIGLSVPLYGAKDQPKCCDQLPLDMIDHAVYYLKHRMRVRHVVVYGRSVGSVFAAMAARYNPGIDGVILVSPIHTVFEGTNEKKRSTGHSVMTYLSEEVPFLPLDDKLPLYESFKEALKDKEAEEKAALPLEELKVKILMIASDTDEYWPSAYAVKYMENRLKEADYQYGYKTVIYHNASHLLGVLPDIKNHMGFYSLLPAVYSTERKRRKSCYDARKESVEEIRSFLDQIADKQS